MFRTLAVLALLHLAAAASFAQSRLALGVQGGFAVEQPLNDYVPSDVRMALGELQFAGALLGNPASPRLEIVGATMFGQSVHPGSRFTVGPTGTFRLHFGPARKVGMYVEAGVGIVSTAMRVPAELTGPFQYALQAGVGLRVRTSKRGRLFIGYRALHFSSHDLTSPNQGLNLHTGIVGYMLTL